MGVEWFGLAMGLGFVLSFGYWCTDFLVVQRALAADSLAAAVTLNAGQVCCTATRWVVHEKIRDQFVTRATATLEAGVLLRPLGATVYWMPPYVIGETEIDFLLDTVTKVMDAASKS